MILIFILIFVSVLLESTLIAYPLTLVSVFLVVTFLESQDELVGFFSGLVLDIFSGRLIGVDSLLFLLFIWIWKHYRNKIYPGSIFFRILFLLLTVVFYNFVFYRNFNFWNLLITLFISALFIIIVDKFFPKLLVKGKLSV